MSRSVVWVSSLSRRTDIFSDGVPTCLSRPALDAVRSRLAGVDLGMFAEASREPDRLTWQVESGGADFRPIGSLAPQAREAFGQAVMPSLAALSGLVNDPLVGHVAAAMLTVESPDALLWDGSRAVIAGWGGWPSDVVDAAGAHALFELTLRPFVPLAAAPVIPAWPAAPARRRMLGGLGPSLAAAVLALALLGGFAWPGVLRVIEDTPVVVPDAPSGPSDEIHGALRARITEYDTMLRGNVCTAATAPRRAAIDPPGTRLPAGPVAPEPPIDPQRTEVPRTETPNAGPNSTTLASHLERATVFVVDGSGAKFGSGFFVSKDRVLTNAHVSGPVGNTLMLGNRVMGRMVGAVVESRTPTATAGEPDFAILKVAGYESPTALSLTGELAPRQPVVAVGYPALVLSTDSSFRRLQETGDPSAIPETVFSDGTVMVVQNRDTPLPLIHHLAVISEGNSGGPLADACGRVVGVNSFIANARTGSARANVSLASGAALAFLQDKGVTVVTRTGTCRTTAVDPPAATPGPPPTAPSSTPPSGRPGSGGAPRLGTPPGANGPAGLSPPTGAPNAPL